MQKLPLVYEALKAMEILFGLELVTVILTFAHAMDGLSPGLSIQ